MAVTTDERITSTLDIKMIESCYGRLHCENYTVLKDVIRGKKIYQSDIPSQGGIYAFWWIGERKVLLNALLQSDYRLRGKQSLKELIQIKFTKE
jgi:hypothetical protein